MCTTGQKEAQGLRDVIENDPALRITIHNVSNNELSTGVHNPFLHISTGPITTDYSYLIISIHY